MNKKVSSSSPPSTVRAALPVEESILPLSPPVDIVKKVATDRINGTSEVTSTPHNICPQHGAIFIDAFYKFAGVEPITDAPIHPIGTEKRLFSSKAIGDLEGATSATLTGTWGLFESHGWDSKGAGPMVIAQETSLLAGVGGYLSILAAGERLEKASSGVIQDEHTKATAAADQAKSSAKVGASTVKVVYRQASIVCYARQIESSAQAKNPTGQLTFFSGIIGTVLTGAFLGLYTAWGSISFAELASFVFRYPGKTYESALAFFKKELDITPESTLSELRAFALEEKTDVRSLFRKEGTAKVNLYLKEAAAFLGKDVKKDINLKEEDIENFLAVKGSISIDDIKEQLTQWGPGWEKLFKNKPLTNLEILGFYVACKKQKDFKAAEMQRCMGTKAFAMVQEHLETPAVKEKDKAEFLKEIKDGFWKEGTWQLFFLSTLAVSSVVVALATVGYFVTNPILALSTAVLNVGVSFVIMGIDATMKAKSIAQEGIVSLVDKVLVHANLLIGVGCLTAIIVLSAATMGTLPAALAITIGAAWVAIAVFDFANLHFRNYRYNETHCSQEELTTRMEALKNKVDRLDETFKTDMINLKKEVDKGHLKDKEIQARIDKLNSKREALSKKVEKQRDKVAYNFSYALDNSFIPEEEKDKIYENFYSVIKVEKIDSEQLEDFKAILDTWKLKEDIIKDAIDESIQFFQDPSEEDETGLIGFSHRFKDFVCSFTGGYEKVTS